MKTSRFNSNFYTCLKILIYELSILGPLISGNVISISTLFITCYHKCMQYSKSKHTSLSRQYISWPWFLQNCVGRSKGFTFLSQIVFFLGHRHIATAPDGSKTLSQTPHYPLKVDNQYRNIHLFLCLLNVYDSQTNFENSSINVLWIITGYLSPEGVEMANSQILGEACACTILKWVQKQVHIQKMKSQLWTKEKSAFELESSQAFHSYNSL